MFVGRLYLYNERVASCTILVLVVSASSTSKLPEVFFWPLLVVWNSENLNSNLVVTAI